MKTDLECVQKGVARDLFDNDREERETGSASPLQQIGFVSPTRAGATQPHCHHAVTCQLDNHRAALQRISGLRLIAVTIRNAGIT